MVQLTIHANAVNVARRLTAQNDHDLMHSCMEETTADVEKEHLSPRKYDHESCQELASHLINAKGLPAQCLQYTDVVTMIRRRETDRTDGTEILS